MEIIEATKYVQVKDSVSCEVCVIGAGAAGIYLASELARNGISVVVLEAGDKKSLDGSEIGIESELDGTDYRGSTDGRYFGLGGSTARWGGLLISHSDLDIRSGESSHFDPWRHIVNTVRKHQTEVAEQLGVDSKRDHEGVSRRLLGDAVQILKQRGVETRAAEFLGFRKKNLAFLLRDRRLSKKDLKIFLGAIANRWIFSGNSNSKLSIRAVSAHVASGSLVVNASHFVMAAGAIECTRMLLEMEHMLGSRKFDGSKSIGRYLSDHLSCPIADVPKESVSVAINRLAPRFLKGRMRSFRFYHNNPTSDEPRSFSHFIFKSENPGFDLAKKILLSYQSKRIEQFDMAEIFDGSAGLMRLAIQRVFQSRLYVDPQTPVQLQLDMEQAPNADNRITLVNKKDSTGRLIPRIEWKIQPTDFENIERATTKILNVWRDPGPGLPHVDRRDNDSLSTVKPHDAYHPVGTCRLGEDRDAVVSPDLNVRGTDNLYVLSTAVFPTAGTANPTFSMLCLGKALSEDLIRLLAESH